MKLSHKIILWILVIFNFVTNIILLVLSYPRSHDNYGFDYMGIIVGILSLLVTLLVAWNIYSALDIKRELNRKNIELNREIKKQYEKQSKDIDNTYKEIKKRISKGEALLQANIAIANASSIDNKSLSKYNIFISHTIKAVMLWAYIEEFSNANKSIDFMLRVLKDKEVCLTKKQIDAYNDRISKIENQDKIDMMEDLKDFIGEIKIK